MEVNRIRRVHQIHLVFTCLTKVVRVNLRQLQRLRLANLSTFTRGDYPAWLMMHLLLLKRNGPVRLHCCEVVITGGCLGDVVLRGVSNTISPLYGLRRLLKHRAWGRMLMTVIAVNAVTAALITQVGGIAPLVRASTPRQDRSMVLRALLLDDELGRLVCRRLLKALPMLHWVLLLKIARVTDV